MEISSLRKTIEYISRTPKRMFILALVVLVIFYLPAFISLYPGTLGYDGPVQLDMYFGGQPVTMHHPVFHTWMMGSLITLGKGLTGLFWPGMPGTADMFDQKPGDLSDSRYLSACILFA